MIPVCLVIDTNVVVSAALKPEGVQRTVILLYATARRTGCIVLTRNIADFDFLQQLDPSGRILIYRV